MSWGSGSRGAGEEKTLRTTHAVMTNCESQRMTITLGDFFEDEVTAHTVRLEDIEEVDSVMNVTDATPGSNVVWNFGIELGALTGEPGALKTH